jgi:hypothetical protein
MERVAQTQKAHGLPTVQQLICDHAGHPPTHGTAADNQYRSAQLVDRGQILAFKVSARGGGFRPPLDLRDAM